MKKRMIVVATALSVVALMTGCGKEADGSLHNMNVEKYVDLCEYENLSVTVNAQKPGIEGADSLLQDLYKEYILQGTQDRENDVDRIEKGRAVENGDIVLIDYEGKKDDVAFQGGTAQFATLEIGSHSFIDGFEDGLIGVMPGETVDLDLTFPEVYHSDELAGQAVVFTVKVHGIYPTEMDDKTAAQIGYDITQKEDIQTVADLRDFVMEYLEKDYDNQLYSSITQTIVEQSTFKEFPKEMQESYRKRISDYFDLDNFEATNGFSADDYFKYYYGMTTEEFLEESVKSAIQQDIAFQAIANAKDLNVSDEELEQKLMEDAEAAGYATVEELLGDNDRELFRNSYMNTKVMDYLKANVTIQ